jgi:hypothetical protein
MLSDTALLITACRRPDCLRRTLGSWSAAARVGELRMVAVALGPSHRLDDQMDVIREAERALGRKITVIRDSPGAQASPGMHRALGEAIDQLFLNFQPGFVLCGEEDVIVSSDVLSYMAWAQERYDDETLCICVHNRGGAGWDGLSASREDQGADQAAVRLLPYFSPWVWCTSRTRWREVIRPVWDWDGDSGGANESGYDWNMQRLSAHGPWRNLVPDAARSQTIGEYAGVYSTPDIFPLQQSRSFHEHREPVSYRLADGELRESA